MLLTETAREGDQQLTLNTDVAAAGWKVGDRIAVAPTRAFPTQVAIGGSLSEAESFTIQSIAGNVVTLDGPLRQARVGRADQRIQAEVINLSRTVTISGDDYDRRDGKIIGLHTIIANGATGEMSYTRFEKGGQRGVLGKYPLHFHLLGDCPDCRFVGNAVETSEQRGIVVHGTQQSTVAENVLFGVKGAGIYIEDGNEMENDILGNVNICPVQGACRQTGTDNPESDDITQSGIWAVSLSNNFVGNRMVNHLNGFSGKASPFPDGRGFAQNFECPQHSAFGNISSNVFHSNQNYGMNLNGQFPRNVDRSVASNGLVTDIIWPLSSCDALTATGQDNGRTAVIQNQLEFGNAFSGATSLGDVQFLNLRVINSAEALFWQADTKPFADTSVTAYVKDSTFEWIDDEEIAGILGSGASGTANIAGPGGEGSFLLENVSFLGDWTMREPAQNPEPEAGDLQVF